MPRNASYMSWVHIRDYCEKFRWTDPHTKLVTEGYNPPSTIPQDQIERVPFSIKYITSKGVVESGYCVCLKVNNRRHQRMVQFIPSNEIRWIRDYLVLEVNGTRFITRSFDQ